MATRNAYTKGNPPVTGHGASRTQKGLTAVVALVATDLTLGQTVGVMRVPAGFTVTSLRADITDVDAGATPTHAFQLGDATVADRLITANTAGQNGGSVTTLAGTGFLYRFPAETEIVLTSSTAAATGAAGTLSLALHGFIDA